MADLEWERMQPAVTHKLGMALTIWAPPTAPLCPLRTLPQALEEATLQAQPVLGTGHTIIQTQSLCSGQGQDEGTDRDNTVC